MQHQHASMAGHVTICQRWLFSDLFQAFAEIADDFMEMFDEHGAEQVYTVSMVATAGILLAPDCGATSHGSPTHALVCLAATEIIGPETTGLLSAALISVSVTSFLCSDWMCRSRCCAPFLKALCGHWTATTCTWAALPCQERCSGKPSGDSASSQDVAPTESSQAGKRGETEVPERRLDPLDGRFYTYQEITSYYGGLFSAYQIKSYWENTCRPMARRKP
eukprot:TRINITY_DN16344_c0_g2_i1.p1 TRINITY_DN16344_c0_g2~~TRINITY_DN16344_c0_g2_i1.p1  ORF type:complete len:240 (+),score=32.10 TRINITY_DN16344_c0_g2_i1:58-720(+)